MSTGEAIVSKIKVYPHPDPETKNLQVGVCRGNPVLVSKEVKDGDVGIFLDDQCQINSEFCMAHKLYRKDPLTGDPMGGYLEANRRVKVIKLRGVKSFGLWLPIDVGRFKEGDVFPGVSAKYISPATLRRKDKKLSNKEVKAFPKHYDTPKLVEVPLQFPCYVTITEKLHGTSARTGLVATSFKDLPWYKKILWFLFRYCYMNGTRNCVIGFNPNEKYRGYWGKYLQKFLRPGLILYYEIVGYDERGRMIMPNQKVGIKELRKKYGDTMIYAYGCKKGESKIYLYRATMHGVELPYQEVCNMKLPTMPLCYRGVVYSMEELMEICNKHVSGPSLLDSSHMREGVCVRVNGVDKAMKYKDWEFLSLEHSAKEEEEYVDVEDI